MHHIRWLRRGGYRVPPGSGIAQRGYPAFESEQLARHCWEDLRDEVLADWIAERPGTRPYAWWKYDAPERRQCLNQVHPFDDPEREEHIAQMLERSPNMETQSFYELYYGTPGSLVAPNDFSCLFETESDYLARLDLLTEYEREEIAAGRGSFGKPISLREYVAEAERNWQAIKENA